MAGRTYYSGELFVGHDDNGIVEVIDTENNVVVRLSLAGAEDLIPMLQHHAEAGRREVAI